MDVDERPGEGNPSAAAREESRMPAWGNPTDVRASAAAALGSHRRNIRAFQNIQAFGIKLLLSVLRFVFCAEIGRRAPFIRLHARSCQQHGLNMRLAHTRPQSS